jgi:protein gp37
MADLFGEWVPDKWIEEVLFQCSEYPRHTYCFLTKNPVRYITTVEGKYDHLLRDTMWFGTTVTGNKDVERISYLQAFDHENTFVSFEPLLEKIEKINLTRIRGAIIGARTNPANEISPEMIQPIGQAAFESGNIPIFNKDSMPLWAKCRRELPWKVNKSLALEDE